MAKFKPTLTEDEFNELWADEDKARGQRVKVSKKALYHLLMDHSQLLGKFEKELEDEIEGA